MSRELYFWRQLPTCELSPREVLRTIESRGWAEGVDPFPMAEFLELFAEEFPTFREVETSDPRVPYQIFWDEPTGSAGFEVQWWPFEEPHLLCIESHGASEDTLERVVDLAIELDVPLYDPRTGIRHESEE